MKSIRGLEMGKPFILGIVGSPRRNGNTERLLRIALDEAKKYGVDCELVTLYDKKIKACAHCDTCLRRRDGECAVKDDFQTIMEKMSQADALILASPVYFGYASPYLSSLISRTRCKFFTEEGTPLANKIGASIAVGGMRYGGQELTMHNIWGFYFVHNMIVVNSEFVDTETGVKACYWGAGGIANHKGDIDKDTEGKLVAEALGRRVAKITCAIQGMADKLVPTRFGEKF